MFSIQNQDYLANKQKFEFKSEISDFFQLKQNENHINKLLANTDPYSYQYQKLLKESDDIRKNKLRAKEKLLGLDVKQKEGDFNLNYGSQSLFLKQNENQLQKNQFNLQIDYINNVPIWFQDVQLLIGFTQIGDIVRFQHTHHKIPLTFENPYGKLAYLEFNQTMQLQPFPNQFIYILIIFNQSETPLNRLKLFSLLQIYDQNNQLLEGNFRLPTFDSDYYFNHNYLFQDDMKVEKPTVYLRINKNLKQILFNPYNLNNYHEQNYYKALKNLNQKFVNKPEIWLGSQNQFENIIVKPRKN